MARPTRRDARRAFERAAFHKALGVSSFRGFRRFLLRGSLIDVAIGIVVGVAFTGLVSSLVKDLITPLIAAVGATPDFSGLYFTVHGSRFRYGEFVNASITFLITVAVLYYLVVKPYMHVRSHLTPSPEPRMRDCPWCFFEISARAWRCPYCTSEIRRTP